MVEQALAPGMQDREEADARAEVPGVCCDLEQGVRNGAKEQTVENPLILESQRC